MKNSTIILTCFIILGLISCESTEISTTNQVELAELDYEYNIEGVKTDLDNDVVKLGRVLFYDPILSENGKVSCASCHKQEFSFADNLEKSIGFIDGLTINNTPHLLNPGNSEIFTWSGTIRDIQYAVTAPIFNPIEMGLSLTELNRRINNAEHYNILIQNAYGRDNLSRSLISEALAQFIESIIPLHSKFHLVKRGQAEFTEAETRGLQLFEIYCNSCHQISESPNSIGPNEDGNFMSDIGLPNPLIADRPVYYTKATQKIPQIWNVSNTAPYMHDGRFNTLKEVIEHYNSGIVDRESTSERVKKISLTEEDKSALIAFLETLDDSSIREDIRFSSPFLQ